MIKRQLGKKIRDALDAFPVVYVNGPRQAGKSTLVQTLASRDKAWSANYVSFDDATTMGAAEASPESFLRAYEGRLIIDEVQMVPGLFRPLKIMVDEARLAKQTDANGRYLLTGSANILALPSLADALVGRMSVLTLYPLSALEVAGAEGRFLSRLLSNGFKPQAVHSKLSLSDAIQRATFPEITDWDIRLRRNWFESYITTLLQRDVRQISDIAKLGMLPHLLRVMASRAGGLINEADVARDLGLNPVTSKHYRIILQTMFLTVDVKPWFRNIGKRLVKSSKGYLVDTSLLCHLQQIDLDKAIKKDPHVFGHVLENFVASEILKQLATSNMLAELYHFRTSNGKEVDFVLEQSGGALAAIEVKSRDAVTEADFKRLKEFSEFVGNDFVCGVVLYRGNKIVPFADKLWAVPIAALWA